MRMLIEASILRRPGLPRLLRTSRLFAGQTGPALIATLFISSACKQLYLGAGLLLLAWSRAASKKTFSVALTHEY